MISTGWRDAEAEIVRLKIAGLNFAEIADRVGWGRHVVQRTCQKAGVAGLRGPTQGQAAWIPWTPDENAVMTGSRTTAEAVRRYYDAFPGDAPEPALHRSEVPALPGLDGCAMIQPALYSSERPDWRTPPEILGMAREAMGGRIHLDPCAPIDAPFSTGAGVAYTPVDDGLNQSWFGNVYLNPPYGRAVGRWIDKAILEIYSRRAECVIALVAARPDTRWFRPLLRHPIAFLHGRLRFVGASQGAPFPSALVMIRRSWTAEDLDRFAHAIGGRGEIVVPWGAI